MFISSLLEKCLADLAEKQYKTARLGRLENYEEGLDRVATHIVERLNGKKPFTVMGNYKATGIDETLIEHGVISRSQIGSDEQTSVN